MKRILNRKRGIAALLIVVMLLNITGCSDFLEKMAVKKVTEYTTDVFDGIRKNPEKTIDQISVTVVSYPEVTDEQRDAVDDVISSLDYEIDKIKLNDKRTKGTVTVALNLIPVFEDDLFIYGTVDEVNEQLDDMKKDVTVDLSIKKKDDKTWVFTDLSELVDLLMTPYQDICYLGEDGNPINITSGYIDMVYVDSAWYDPLMNNPMNTNRIQGTDYLKVVFYFNRPMNMDLTFEVLYNGTSSQTEEIVLNNDITADCHINAEQGFESGSYQFILYYGDTVIAESETLTVG